MTETRKVNRRVFLQGLAVLVPAPLVLATESAGEGASVSAEAHAPSGMRDVALRPTPACDDGDDPTPSQTEGPFFTPRSPERRSLLTPDLPGTRLVVSGYVLTTACEPVANALLDFWQADDSGTYDNDGYRLRGHQFTDEEGRFELETVVPGLYPGRTRHIHVKVQAPEQRVLTTQLYFPGEPRNQRDRIFHSDLLMTVTDEPDGRKAEFDFVLRMGE